MQQRPKGREIPHSEEAERGFLSSILQQPILSRLSLAI